GCLTMVDLSAKKPPYSREEIEASLLEYVFSEASNEQGENTAEALTNEITNDISANGSMSETDSDEPRC
ncbi:hypothetical protein, partial [uncultured Selenomonas sp.]|uniref:hypothetical protein n=1 Tax=uncultured Selenomonas sp. TaxID=159275 RepID=UPI0025EE57AF